MRKCDFHDTKCPLAAILKIAFAQSGIHFERVFQDDSFEIGLTEEELSVRKILKKHDFHDETCPLAAMLEIRYRPKPIGNIQHVEWINLIYDLNFRGP